MLPQIITASIRTCYPTFSLSVIVGHACRRLHYGLHRVVSYQSSDRLRRVRLFLPYYNSAASTPRVKTDPYDFLAKLHQKADMSVILTDRIALHHFMCCICK